MITTFTPSTEPISTSKFFVEPADGSETLTITNARFAGLLDGFYYIEKELHEDERIDSNNILTYRFAVEEIANLIVDPDNSETPGTRELVFMMEDCA